MAGRTSPLADQARSSADSCWILTPVHFARGGFRIGAGGFGIEPGRLDIVAGGFDPGPGGSNTGVGGYDFGAVGLNHAPGGIHSKPADSISISAAPTSESPDWSL